MRSPRQIAFRLVQEVSNLRLAFLPPKPGAAVLGRVRVPADGGAAEHLKSTAFAGAIAEEADRICSHRFRVLGFEIETGPEIRWRRDYINHRESAPLYLRKIPYLDFEAVGDHKIVWELNRHQHLVVLAQAFLFTGERRYLDEIQRQIESWLEQNPFQHGMNWTSALEVAFRALSWMWLWRLVGSEWTAPFRNRFLESIDQHGLHIEANLSVYFSPNTHLLGEAVALHALGETFREFPSASRWSRKGARIVGQEMQRQVRNDGSHFEQSSYYHVYALDMFLFHAICAGEISDAYRKKLHSMADYLDALLGPDRTLPLIGDDDGGRFFHPYGSRVHFGKATLATCAAFLGIARWQYSGEDLWPQAAWWLGTFGGSSQGAPGPSCLFRDSGVGVMRHGDVHAVIDAGPFGPGRCGHSHSDTLSFVLRAGGREILIDPGTYTYVGDPAWREIFRGSAGHNTIRIDGYDQATASGPFWWTNPPAVKILNWQSDESADVLEAECRFRGFCHRRRIEFRKPDEIVVTDEVAGPAGRHEIEQFWHLGSGPKGLITFDGVPEIIEGWRSRAFGTKEPAEVVRISRRTELPCRFVTRFRLA